MIISFRCPPKLKDQIDALIAKGLYPDFSSFCVIALENQLLLEKESSLSSGQEKTLKNRIPLSEKQSSEESSEKKYCAKPKKERSNNEVQSSLLAPVALPGTINERIGAAERQKVELELPNAPFIPAELNLNRLNGELPFSLPSMLSDVFQPDQIVPIERWFFGQYNRLLPAKVSIRALAGISLEGKDSLALTAVAPRIAEIAGSLSEYLRFLDKRFANHRDDSFATAFPDRGSEGQKGRVRYQNHFVGHTVKGEQGGMLIGLKLAVIQVVKNKPHILPTTAGWAFARFPNPILDEPANQNSPRLSKDEITFLLKHIRINVPIELFAYRVILSLIDKGKNTPELVNQNLARYVTPNQNLENKQDFIATQRNGVIGRMTDLGLVNRERLGTRITYHLTPDGGKFLEDVGMITVTL